MRGSCRPATATTLPVPGSGALVLLFGLLGASLALFASNPRLRTDVRAARAAARAARPRSCFAAVARRRARRRPLRRRGAPLRPPARSGFVAAAASTLLFAIAPVLGGGPVGTRRAWAEIARPAARGGARSPRRRSCADARRSATRCCGRSVAATALALAALWVRLPRAPGRPRRARRAAGERPPAAARLHARAARAAATSSRWSASACASARRREDLDRWLALGLDAVLLFAALHCVFTPLVTSEHVSQGDFLRVLAYGVLLVGVWRAIRSAEFGRAVAEERARVAREIHDGLAQYLFAVSTQRVDARERRADRRRRIPRLKEAAALAQQEARFAVLALSSASGNAPFDAALRRYVEFLTADGELEVELDIDAAIRARARRADRGLPHRPGRARERPQARGRPPRGGPDRPARRTALRARARRRRRLRRRLERAPARD